MGSAASASRSRREKHSDMGQDILEGYIVSAGVDQKVFLWSVQSGRCVGEFGSFGWDINNEATWYRKAEAAAATGSKKRGHSSSSRPLSAVVPARLYTSASMITRDSLEASLDTSHSAYVLRTIGRHSSEQSVDVIPVAE